MKQVTEQKGQEKTGCEIWLIDRYIITYVLKTHVSDNSCPLATNNKIGWYRFTLPAAIIKKFGLRKKKKELLTFEITVKQISP